MRDWNEELNDVWRQNFNKLLQKYEDKIHSSCVEIVNEYEKHRPLNDNFLSFLAPMLNLR